MANEPTAEQLAGWVQVSLPDPTREAWLDEVIAATVEHIEAGYWITGNTWSARQHTAGLMLAARLYKRRASPEGVAGFGDLGVVRIIAGDPDIQDLLASSEVLSGFA